MWKGAADLQTKVRVFRQERKPGHLHVVLVDVVTPAHPWCKEAAERLGRSLPVAVMAGKHDFGDDDSGKACERRRAQGTVTEGEGATALTEREETEELTGREGKSTLLQTCEIKQGSEVHQRPLATRRSRCRGKTAEPDLSTSRLHRLKAEIK